MDWSKIEETLVIIPEKGTAFIISPEGFALTCNHVVNGDDVGSNIDCKCNQEDMVAEIILKDEKIDIAIIKIIPYKRFNPPFICVDLGFEPLNNKSIEVKFIGQSKVEYPQFIQFECKLINSNAKIRDKPIQYMLMDKKSYEGMSGGPVWYSGLVIGIINAKIEYEKINGIEYCVAIPMSTVFEKIFKSKGISDSLRTVFIKSIANSFRNLQETIFDKSKIEVNIDLYKNKSDIIQEIQNREDYFKLSLKFLEKAEESVYLCIHTLKPSHSNENIEKIQNILLNQKVKGRDIKILAPDGVDRIEAGYEIAILKQIPVKFLRFLEDGDLRFILIDTFINIIAINDENSNYPSNIGIVIKSEHLNLILRSYFNDLWTKSESLSLKEMIKKEINNITENRYPISIDGLSKRFKIPIEFINEIITKAKNYKEKEIKKKIFFIFGKPGSGKSTASKILKENFHNLKFSNVITLNDYDILYDWFKDDKEENNFESVKYNGFRVKNFTILNDALKKLDRQLRSQFNQESIFIIEFSRNDYIHALSFFPQEIQKYALYIYLYCSLDICLERNEIKALKSERGYVPPDIIKSYYKKDNYVDLLAKLQNELIFIKNENKIEEFKNNLIEKINEKIREF